ncbi:MAG: choice-of-anchor V domain-containing protein [Saprospiraceae bacterium]
MQFYQLKYIIPFIFFCFILFLGNSGNPPDGYTGAPFNSTCGSCHGGGSFDGVVDISGFPSTILPNTTYDITLTASATSGTPIVGGFQLVAVNAANQNSGDLINVSGQTGTTTSGSREYIDQRGAKAYTGNSVSWDFKWTSPNGPSGSVITLYFSSNMANGNGSSSGDRSINSSKSGTMMGGGNPLGASITQKKNISCFGGSDGEATVTATGGFPPYSYIWSNGQTSNKADMLSFGSQTVTVTDNMGSTATASTIITQPGLLQHDVKINKQVSCPGGRDGSVTTTALGGTAPYNYIYSNGSSSNLSAGLYSVTVSDANGCNTSSTFVITEPDTFSVNTITFQNPICPSDSNGLIKLGVAGGNPPYKFKWSTNDTSSQISNKKVGNYKVTITDAKNCNTIRSYELQSKDSIAPQLISKNAKAYLGITGIALPSISEYFTTNKDNCDPNPKLIINIDTFKCAQIGKRNFILQSTDANGNKSTASVEIEILDTIKPIIHRWNDTIFYACNIQVPQINASDNCSISEFKKLSGPDPGTIFPVGRSVFIFSAKDGSNNEILDSFKVDIVQPLTFTIDTFYFNYCTGDTSYHVVQLMHSQGKLYDFIYNNDTIEFVKDTLITLQTFNTDSLKFKVVENSGCSIDYKINIDYPGPILTLDAVLVTDESDINKKDGSILATIPGADSIAIFDAFTKGYINSTGLNLAEGIYELKAYKASCVFTFGPYTIKLITSTENNESIDIKLVPNPFENELSIISNSKFELKYKLFNASGELITNGVFLNNSILNLSNLKSGIYFLVCADKNQVLCRRIMKI